MMTKQAELFNYEWLLDRVYANLPQVPVRRRERFTVPKPEVMISGKRTFILNFKQICVAMNRDMKQVLRYILKELAAPGEVQDTTAVIQGEFAPRTIASLIDRFVKYYVVCPVCGSPDTSLKKERKVMYLKCMACGAKSPVQPF